MDTKTPKALLAERNQLSDTLSLCRHLAELLRWDRIAYELLIQEIHAVADAPPDSKYTEYSQLCKDWGGSYDSRTFSREEPNRPYPVLIPNTGVFSYIFDGRGRILGWEELVVNVARMTELDEMFEITAATTATDARYGRNRWHTVYKATGEMVSSSVDREGSLGT